MLKPIPTQYLPILASIAPASVRLNAAYLRLALKYALTEHFNTNLVRLNTRPRLKTCKCSAFKGPRNCNVQILCFQKDPQQTQQL